LAAAAVLWIALHYRHDVAAARDRIGRGSQVVETTCGRIEYASAGSGRPLLVVHGAGGGFDQGMGFAAPLAGRGMRVVAMSRFGYLRTPLPADAGAEAQADAHACLMDALGIERAAILGASAGAPSALQFALRHPTRTAALVLLVPAAYVPRPQGEPSVISSHATQLAFETALRWDFAYWAARKIAPQFLARALLATPTEVIARAGPAERARVDTMLDHILPIAPRRLGLLNDARVTSALPRYPLERIAAPTLVASAADDLFGTYDSAVYTARHVPNARFLGFPEGGHIWVGHQEALIAAITSFLEESAP
jgi:pimeloyl-ACP methyl ester carboxylesterase